MKAKWRKCKTQILNLEELKNKHAETNNTITEIKNTLEGINSRISAEEEQISELEDKIVGITSEEHNKVERLKRAEDSERATGRKARGLQMEEIGCKCQTFFSLS